MVVHACNPSTQLAEKKITVSLRPTWSTQQVPDRLAMVGLGTALVSLWE